MGSDRGPESDAATTRSTSRATLVTSLKSTRAHHTTSKLKPNSRRTWWHSRSQVQTYRMKAVAVPGYQVPFGGREMPLPYGWGTGGIQVTAAIIGRDDTAEGDRPGRRRHDQCRLDPPLLRACGLTSPRPRTRKKRPSSRRAIACPRRPSKDGQILVFQVPIPEPLRMLEPRETETRTLHALSEYGVMQVSLYESIARHGRIAKTYNYPVHGERALHHEPLADPEVRQPQARPQRRRCSSTAPAARSASMPCRRYTPVKSLDFDDHPFEIETWSECCALLRLHGELSRRDDRRRCRQAPVRLLRHRLLRGTAMSAPPLSSPSSRPATSPSASAAAWPAVT